MEKLRNTSRPSKEPIRPKSLDRFRPTFFLVGLALSLMTVLVAFEWQTAPPNLETDEIVKWEDEDYQEVIRTAPPKPPTPPPPPVPKKFDLVLELPQEDTTEEIEPEVVEETIEVTTEDLPIGPPSKPIPPPPAPPKPEPKAEPEIEIPISIAERMPVFGDCDPNELSREEIKLCSNKSIIQYLGKEIKYPALARENGIQGTVVVRFIVEKDGSITGEEVVRDIGGGCGKEALRVVRNMPLWQPGKQRGRPVRVFFTLPVKYTLQ